MKKKRKAWLVFAVAVVAILTLSGTVFTIYAQPGINFIANSSVPGDSIAKADIKKIFTGVRIVWEDGNAITPVTMKSSAAHKVFTKKYTGKSAKQFKVHWRHLAFTGRGTIPVEFNSDKAIIDFVAQTPGSIGYVSSLESSSSVKTIKITK